MEQAAEFERRVADLAGFEEFIRVMSAITPGDITADPIAPSIADTAMRRSAFLSSLEEIAPDVVAGPLQLDAQFWIGTGKPPTAPTPHRGLNRRHFNEIGARGVPEPSTKPFSVGLYTSTGLLGTHGMWELYLETTRSSLFLPPWQIWTVQPVPGVDVLEIAGAADWAEFVSAYPLLHNGLVYPDWLAVSRDHDAVHMTLRAVAATQGISLQAGNQKLAPTYWDIESTLWLRWCFGSARCVATLP